MATTSIWSVKGWLGKVLIYVENLDKTDNPDYIKMNEMPDVETQGLSDVIAYAMNEKKTMQQYVSGINCSPMTARTEMLAVKRKFDKEEGIIAYHGYQSFAEGECTPDIAHEIGVKLAEELWGNRFQVIVATHLDKAHHLHNHFVVNAVSFTDGKRYRRTNQDYRDMRNVSDRLCREYGLSVVENKNQKVTRNYGEWKREKEGKPTYRGLVRADVDEAIVNARTEKQFFFYLKEKGYTFKIGKDITVKPPGRERGIKLARNFGDDYTIEQIRKRILNTKQKPVSEKKNDKVVFTPVNTIKVYGFMKPKRRIGGLRGLYLHYCYRLGILPRRATPIDSQKIHPLLREELCKMETISKEARLLCRYHIETTEQLSSFREGLQGKMQSLCEERSKLRNQIRRMKDDENVVEAKDKVSSLTKEIGETRKEMKLCDGIAARSVTMKEKLKVIQQENKQEKEEKNYEYRRGRS